MSNKKEDINLIVGHALEILCLDLRTFQKIAGETLTKNLTPDGQLNLDHAPGIEVIDILKLLYLGPYDIMDGYDQERHLTRICNSIENGEFRYKKGKIVKAFFRYFKAARWEGESRHLNFKRRWKVRLKRWLMALRICKRY